MLVRFEVLAGFRLFVLLPYQAVGDGRMGPDGISAHSGSCDEDP